MRSIKKFFSKRKSHLKKMIASKKKLFIITLSLFIAFGSLSFFFFQGNKSVPSPVPSSSELGIGAFSPLGESGGSVVPASCPADLHDAPANYGTACTSAPNDCGSTNTGSINCGGVCSVGPPPSACAPCFPWGFLPFYSPSFGRFVFILGPWFDWYSRDDWVRTLAHGDSVPYYDAPSVTAPATCTGGEYTCFNRVLLGYTPGMVTYESCDVIEAFVCTGPIPPNTSVYPGDSTGLTVDTNYSYSATNTAPKCQYSCDGGYEWNGSGCASSASSSCTSNCSTTQNNHCGGATYTGTDSCGNAETCTGTRYCDYNWKEVAP